MDRYMITLGSSILENSLMFYVSLSNPDSIIYKEILMQSFLTFTKHHHKF